jgi:ATP-binding cassette, subfamily A (ABC1), member 3
MITVPNRSAGFDYDAFMFTILDQFLPMATLLVFFLPVFRMTYRMVSEKETRIRESMTMMGLTQHAYWISWFLYFLIFDVIISVTSATILRVYLLKHSTFLVILLYFFSFGLSLFGFIIFCQAFWDKARHAAIFTVVFYIATASSSILVTPQDVPMA